MEDNVIKMVKGKKSKVVKQVEEQIKEKAKPVFIKDLELGSGEVYVGDLSERDKFQLISRRMAMQENILHQTLFLLSNCTICLQEIAKKQGIEIDKILNFGKEE